MEKQIREANRQKRLASNNPNNTASKKPVRQLRDLEEVKKEMRNGYENTWKIWKCEEFCEKDVIIFGQLEKKQ